jgi:hypothetical protein
LTPAGRQAVAIARMIVGLYDYLDDLDITASTR